MTKAFPDVSWVYLFRNPVEVMVSNLKVRETAKPYSDAYSDNLKVLRTEFEAPREHMGWTYS